MRHLLATLIVFAILNSSSAIGQDDSDITKLQQQNELLQAKLEAADLKIEKLEKQLAELEAHDAANQDLAPPGNAIEKATAQYSAAYKAADEKLILAFDKQIELVRKTAKLKPAEKQTFIDAIESEKAAFEKHGAVPFSSPMRESTAAYLTQLDRARTPLMKAYDKAIDHAQVKDKDDAAAADLAAEKEKLLSPKVVGTFDCQGVNFKLSMKLTLNADFTGQPAKPHRTWTINKNGIVMRFPSPNAPGGFFVETCTFDDSGQSFVSKNQEGGSYRGTRIDP